jgi:hypothetical protein
MTPLQFFMKIWVDAASMMNKIGIFFASLRFKEMQPQSRKASMPFARTPGNKNHGL